MSTVRTIDDITIVLYGFRDNRWIKVSRDFRSNFYGQVPDNFTLDSVTGYEAKYNDPNYCEGLTGYHIWYNDGRINVGSTDYYYPALPCGDPNLYVLVDDLITLAEALKIDNVKSLISGDNSAKLSDDGTRASYSVTPLRELMGKVHTLATDNNRLLSLLKGKDTLTLLKELDTANLQVAADAKTIAAQEITNTDLKAQLEEAQQLIKRQSDELVKQAVIVAELQEERNGYKQELLNKVRTMLAAI